MSQEQHIIDGICAWLTDIRVANGYHTDAGLAVFDDEYDIPDTPSQEMLFVVDGEETAGNGRGRWTMSVTIEAWAVLAPDAAPNTLRSRARLLVADISRALTQGKRRRDLPAGAIEVREIGRRIPLREQGDDILSPSVTLEIVYSDLYTQEQ